MAYVVVTCAYSDGREADEVKLKPKAWLAVERKFGAEFPPREATMYAAWVQLAPDVEFDVWVDSLESCMDSVVDPQKEASPTPEGLPPLPSQPE